MTEQELTQLIASRMPFAAEISSNSHLFDELGFDSVLLLDLIIDIEERCGMQFFEAELTTESLRTPRAILEMISAHATVEADRPDA